MLLTTVDSHMHYQAVVVNESRAAESISLKICIELHKFFLCIICDKQFTQKSHEEIHSRLHSCGFFYHFIICDKLCESTLGCSALDGCDN